MTAKTEANILKDHTIFTEDKRGTRRSREYCIHQILAKNSMGINFGVYIYILTVHDIEMGPENTRYKTFLSMFCVNMNKLKALK